MQAFFDFFLGDFLHLEIGCGINFEPLGVQHLATVFLLDVTADLLGVIRDFFDIQIATRFDLHFGVDGLVGLRLCDKSLGHHTVEHIYLPLFGPFRVPEWRVLTGRLG